MVPQPIFNKNDKFQWLQECLKREVLACSNNTNGSMGWATTLTCKSCQQN